MLASAIFFERFIRFTVLQRRGRRVANRVAEYIAEGNREAAVQTARNSCSPMGRVLIQGLEVMYRDRETLETVLINAVDEEVRDLSRHLQILATVTNMAPLLGLLGTVVGMIKAFMVIQQMGGKVNAAVLAGGIWEAMLTTALGLAVALPAMVAHSYLAGRVDRYEARLQTGTVGFIKNLAFSREN